MQNIGVLGAGAWGTALAAAAVEAGRDTLLWAREPEGVSAINETHVNTVFLPEVTLDERLKATQNLNDMSVCDAILLVTPAQHLRSMTATLLPHLKKGVPLIICSKGIEVQTGQLMSQAIKEITQDHPVGVLSGPTFAIEVARGLPCAITLATEDEKVGQSLVQAIGLPTSLAPKLAVRLKTYSPSPQALLLVSK